MLNKLRALVKAGNTFCGYLSGLGILAMSLILAYEVVMRGIFKAPTIWVMNTAISLFMWTMLVGAAYTLMLGKHVRIDLIFDKFPKRIQLYLDVVTSIMGIVFCVVVSWQAWLMIASSIRLNKLTDNLLHIPVWWIQLPLLLGFGLLALQFFINLLDRIVALRAGEGLSE